MNPATNTPYPLNKLKLYWSQFLSKNKHNICGHLGTPYILVIKNFMTPHFSFQKYTTPLYIWDPPSKENDSPNLL